MIIILHISLQSAGHDFKVSHNTQGIAWCHLSNVVLILGELHVVM